MRVIRQIEPTMDLAKLAAQNAKKRVAAYARVSSGKDAALDSLSAQISYYSAYIQKREDWEFAGIYADEAITGTKDRRAEFQRLLADCRAGKIDLVITKSVPRFARNTVTLLETVRELKALNIDVYFERENIHSISSDGEFMLTLLASYAQEESLSASENTKWRIRKNFQNGQTHPLRMLGYKLVDGVLCVVPEEAEIVRIIFSDYLSGMGAHRIAKKLIQNNIPTLAGGRWKAPGVMKILQNEKYTGNMILQKTFIQDPISKKKVKNTGQLPKYYVESSHEAIIDAETFDIVGQEIVRRAEKWATPGNTADSPFSGIIHCGICGASFSRGKNGKRYTWMCRTFSAYGKEYCASSRVPEYVLEDFAVKAMGIQTFDSAAFAEEIASINVTGHRSFSFVFRDGREYPCEWAYPSRSESWTDEMRQAAREKRLKAKNERGAKQ